MADNAQVTVKDHPIQSTYTQDQINQLTSFINNSRQPQSQTFDRTDSNRLVFFAAFDGTGNDRNDPTRPETNVSRIERAMDSALASGNQGQTFYRRGPGTSGNRAEQIGDTITGASVEQTARVGYEAFADYVRSNPGKEITISGIGFSRGAATLSAFSNMVYTEGVPDLSSARIVDFVNGKEVVSYERYLIQPATADLGLLVMLDRVATGNARTPALQELPPAQNMRILSIQALDERDNLFRIDSFRDKATGQLDPRVTEIWIPGVHSDIGAGYKDNGIALNVLVGFREFIASSGQPIGALRPEDSADGKSLAIHNSFGGRRTQDDPDYGPGVGGWVSESRDENSVRYNNNPYVIDSDPQTYDDGSNRIERTYWTSPASIDTC